MEKVIVEENRLKNTKKVFKAIVRKVGIANTLGRIVLGFLSDRQWINRLYLYNMPLADRKQT
jgi:hypothetical protein